MSPVDGFQVIRKVLIANRGEIACRIIASCKRLDLTSVAIYSKADRSSLHVRLADEACLLPGSDQSAYIDEDAILEIAKSTGAQAVIPGYGFLSENDGFAERVEAAGLTWVGPSSHVIRQFGLKHTARELAVNANVPVITGTPLLESAEEALAAAEKIGYPVMLKATAGGGGMGLQICQDESEIAAAFDSVHARGATLFKNTAMFMEKYVARSRHVEVQVFGNGLGDAVHFGERECSIQRRHQKVVEECPSPFVHARKGMRKRLTDCAVKLASSVAYGSAGTVEFLVDDTTGEFYFLEMNTRLQVEHGITEMCWDVDLVSLMLQQAEMQARGAGGIPIGTLSALQKSSPTGYAIEARVYAEIPSRNFAPSPGLLQSVNWHSGDGIRVDTWVTSGTQISPFYDPMIAKVIVWDAHTHHGAVEKMVAALSRSIVQGCPTNIKYLRAIVESDAFAQGDTTTAFLTSSAFNFVSHSIDVLSGGAYTTIQDLPARRGVGHGVPEAGPMDSVSFRVANVIAGNDENTEALEVTLIGPELKFHVAATVAVTGGVVDVTVDGVKHDMYTRIVVPAGGTLKVGVVSAGCRSYVAVRGGFPDIPKYLGSKSTTTTLKLGGYQGRHLVANDSIDLDPQTAVWAAESTELSIPSHARLDSLWSNDWTLHVMPGPHDDPEFVTENDRTTLYESPWKISHNASRSGYRLKGPRLEWSRAHGGEGGAHPANVIDEPYSYGGLNWNGDEPVVLPIDAPMAGGLATTTTIVRADFWRLGQCRPGDMIRFKRISWTTALALRKRTEAYVASIRQFAEGTVDATALAVFDLEFPSDWDETILYESPATAGAVEVKYRQAGDSHIHVTYGPMTTSVLTRAHIQHRVNRIEHGAIPGIISVIGTTRAYCVQFDTLTTTQSDILQRLIDLETSLGSSSQPIPSRIFRFPVLLDDPVCKATVDEYARTLRDSAVYLPDNMEYVAKANGVVDGKTARQSLVLCPHFLAGTPLMVPLDPRLIYVAQKYNPVRAFTAEGTVGIGGPLVVIYPMDAPGGYQLWARTLSPWDSYASRPHFEQPWLLRDFDQIQFYEVGEAEFDRCYEEYKAGRFKFEIEETTFDPVAYATFLASIATETEEFVKRRNAAGHAAGEEERRLLHTWRSKQSADEAINGVVEDASGVNVAAPMSSSVWKLLVAVGDVVEDGQVLAILEAMKMEIPIRAEGTMSGLKVTNVAAGPGTVLEPGQTVMVLGA